MLKKEIMGLNKDKSRKTRIYSEDIRKKVVRLASTIGPYAIAKELTIPHSIIYNWAKKYPELEFYSKVTISKNLNEKMVTPPKFKEIKNLLVPNNSIGIAQDSNALFSFNIPLFNGDIIKINFSNKDSLPNVLEGIKAILK